MKKSVFVAKDLNYAASKTSTTVNTATSPDLLRDGAIGIYGLNSSYLPVLITDGASGTDLLAAASTIKEFFIAVGTATGCKTTGTIKVSGVTCKSSAYVAGTKQVFSVGYNKSTSSGALSIPTIAKGNEILFKVIDSTNPDSLGRTGDTYSGYATSNASTVYDMLLSLMTNLELDTNRKVDMDIVANGTSTAASAATSGTNKSVLVVASGTPAVTGSIANESKTLTLTLASSTVSSVNFAAGDKINIAGYIYEIVTVGATGAITLVLTLDRAYKGTTLSAAAASNFKFFNTADPTEYGFELTDVAVDYFLDFAFLEGLSSTDTAVITAPVLSNGTYAKISKKEEESWVRTLRRQTEYALPSVAAVSGTTYDQYIFDVKNPIGNNDGTGTSKVSEASVTIAMDSAMEDNGGEAQSDFEDIITALGITFTSIVA